MTILSGTDCGPFNRCLIGESEKAGEAIYDAKFYANQNYGWDHYYEYMNMYNFNFYGDSALERKGLSRQLKKKAVSFAGAIGLHQ